MTRYCASGRYLVIGREEYRPVVEGLPAMSEVEQEMSGSRAVE